MVQVNILLVLQVVFSFKVFIDLSLSSISYAKRKTDELAIRNAEYMQADILDLGRLNKQFDIVESIGVLCMNDPFEVGRYLQVV